MQLIGVLITLLVIGIASVFLYTHFSAPGRVTPQTANQVVDTATDTAITADIKNIKAALEVYKVQNGSYPDSLQNLVISHQLSYIPINPKTHAPYIYYTDGDSFKLTAKNE